MPGRRGGRSSTGSPTRSRSWPGTGPAPAGRTTRRARSPCRTSRTASPGSSRRSAWSGRTSPACRSAAGSRSSSYRRHPELPRSLILVSAYAGWAGSLPPDAVEHRLRQAVELADLPPERFAGEVLPTLFSASTPPELVARFADAVTAFHPAGLRAMARAFAEADLRDVLPHIAVPTLLVAGEEDARAPVTVTRALHAAIPGSTLVVLPGTGHVISLEAPGRFAAEVRAFLAGR